MRIHESIRRLFRRILLLSVALPLRANAAVFDGGGLPAGLGAAGSMTGLSHKPIRELIIAIVINILNFLSLAAVVVIVAAGIYLLVSFGEESARDKAKRIIIDALIGLVIVFLARVAVGFVIAILQSSATTSSTPLRP